MKTITINDQEKRIEIKFPFDYSLVNAVKKIPNRKFSGKNKLWHIPLNTDLNPIIRFGKDHDFDIQPEIIDTFIKKEKQQTINFENSKQKDTTFEVKGLKMKPYPYQKAGIAYAVQNKKVIIGDEMGLGKTIQAIGTIYHLKEYPVMIVCPASLKYNWKKEVKKWTDLHATIIESNGIFYQKSDIYIINYDIVDKLKKRIEKLNIKTWIFDESHYLKSKKAKRTKACMELSKNSETILCLSGTMIKNRPSELISILEILGKLNEFGGYWHFTEKYCAAYKTQYGRDINGSPSPNVMKQLHEKLRRICYIRREKKNVLKELPDKTIQEISLDIDNIQEYRFAEQNLIEYLQKNKRKINENIEMAQHLVRISELKKLAAKGKLKSIVKDLKNIIDNDQKVVVFVYHKFVADLLVKEFNCNKITGDVKAIDRQKYVDDFQENLNTKILVLNIQAGGVGITLTASNIVCFVELGWTPADHDQAIDRCHRIGQKNNVLAKFYLGKNTIDEKISQIINEKRKITNALNKGEVSDMDSNKNIVKEILKAFNI